MEEERESGFVPLLQGGDEQKSETSSGSSSVPRLDMEKVSSQGGDDSDSPPYSQPSHSQSYSPPDSREKAQTISDIQKIFAAIADPDNQDLYDEVKLIPNPRLRAAATFGDLKHGVTLLHKAAEAGDEQILQLLLDHGADKFIDALDVVTPGEYGGRGSPLAFAVESGNHEVIMPLLTQSNAKADALCAAINFYSASKSPDAETHNDHEIHKRTLDWLLTLPEIVGARYAQDCPEDKKNLTGCVVLPDQRKNWNAFQWLSFNCESEYFFRLRHLLPDPRSDGVGYFQRRDEAGNNFLHLAIIGSFEAETETESDCDFIKDLMDNTTRFVDELNAKNQTPLSLACALGMISIVKVFAQSKMPLLPPKADQFVSPVEIALQQCNGELLDLLLEQWPEDSRKLLEYYPEKICAAAIKPWYLKLLTKQDSTAEAAILNKLLKADQTNAIFDAQIRATEAAIQEIEDEYIKTSLSNVLTKVSSDFQSLRNMMGEDDLNLKMKMLGLIYNVQQVAVPFSRKSTATAKEKEKAKEDFFIVCRTLLYTNSVRTLIGIAVCALLGFVVGAIVGFIVGTVLSGGGPGGLELGPKAAKHGAELGLILGCIFLGSAAASVRYFTSELFKWTLTLWSVNRALNAQINKVSLDSEYIPVDEDVGIKTTPLVTENDGSNDSHKDSKDSFAF